MRRGKTWRSPVVRLRVGEPVERTIAAYRRDNGIDRYPSVARKLGPKLATLAPRTTREGRPHEGASPVPRLVGRPPPPAPPRARPPGLLPAAAGTTSFPDFAARPRLGTTADFRAAVAEMHRLGQLAMPYLNVSWWDEESPTMRALRNPADVAVLDQSGRPVVIAYADKAGIVVSPFSPFVRTRVADLFAQLQRGVPTDCLFFDQIGARPWLRDFNAASPTPLAFGDGWLEVMSPYAGRSLMVEDGWDRLAASFSAFHERSDARPRARRARPPLGQGATGSRGRSRHGSSTTRC